MRSLHRDLSASYEHWLFHSDLSFVRQREHLPLIAIVASVGFATLGKAGAIDALGLLVTSSTIHMIAQALREVDNHRPTCQRAGGTAPLIV
jgi:hypothetical protein